MKTKTVTLNLYFREIVQALFSMLFNFTGLIAGGLVATYFELFEQVPWAIVLYPGILSIRGAIGGLMSGRISTALHLGTIKPQLFNNTREARVLFNTVTLLTLMSSIMMWGFGTLFSVVFAGAVTQDLPQIFLVLLSTMGLSIIFISSLTFLIGILSYNRGVDPDVFVYPVVSTVSDVVITLLYLLVLTIVVRLPENSWYVLGTINLIFIAFVFFSIKDILNEKDFRETVKEFTLTLFFVSVIVNITGSALSKISEDIGRKKEIYMIYPALIDTVGDVGSIIGSTATTKMALGLMATSLSDIKFHLKEILSSWIASLIMFLLYALTSSVFYGTLDLVKFLRVVFSAHLIVVPGIILISLSTAIETRKRGLDPDNFIIPIETSISDGLTTIALMIVLGLFL